MELLNPFDFDLKNTILIEASAGTGKTYTITTIYVRLVLKGYRPDSILVVTFTEAAASELKLRIRDRVAGALSYLEHIDSVSIAEIESDREFYQYLESCTHEELENRKKNLRTALNLFDEASILTIHSFCLKMLKENAFESGTPFDMELSLDSFQIRQEISFDFFAEKVNNLDPLFLKYLKKRNFVPESLMSKFSRLLSRPDIELIPAEAEFKDVFDEYRALTCRIRTYISCNGTELEDYIKNSPEINKQSYRKNLVAKWLEQTARQLSHPDGNIVFDMHEKGDPIYKFTLTRLKEKLKPGHDLPDHEFFNLCQKLFELNKAFEKNILSLELSYFEYLKKGLEKNREKLGIVFFNDLINNLARALRGRDGQALAAVIREKYRAALIDEFQDTDQTQYSIFSKLFTGRKNLFCMIGDPKQAIYGFRGGDIFAYLRAVGDCRKVYTLNKNYRSDSLLVQAVNAIFQNRSNPFMYEKIGFYPVTTPESSGRQPKESKAEKEKSGLTFIFLNQETMTPDLDRNGFITKAWAMENIPLIIAGDMAELLGSDTLSGGKKLAPADIAVIVRKNDQAKKINRALELYNIPSHIHSNDSVFESREAGDITVLLHAVLEPDNTGYVRAALLTGIFDFSGNDLDDLDQEEGAFAAWQQRFLSYHNIWQDHGFIRLIQHIFHSDKAFSKENIEPGERALTNYYHLIELLHYAESDNGFSPVFLLKWFVREQNKARKNASLEELRLETDDSAVSIVTIHRSKGLEWPVVYLPYLWDGRIGPDNVRGCLFHDPDKDYNEKFDMGYSGNERAVQLADYEARAEDVRLLYVALTRAASMVKVLWGRFNSVGSSALGHILHGTSVPDDDGMLENIGSLIKGGARSIKIDTYNPAGFDEFIKRNAATSQIHVHDPGPRMVTRSLSRSWEVSSFSSMISSIDHRFIKSRESRENISSDQKILLKDFPAGPGSGEFFHTVFEHLDFCDCSENIEALVELHLKRFGYDPELWKDTICKAVQQILSTRLLQKSDALMLKNIEHDKRLNELEFFFTARSVNGKKLYQIFNNHMQHPRAKEYTVNLLSLDSKDIKGFIKGFIDLVFKFDDKWYIVDYKSNFLGSSYGDYSDDAMGDAMVEHHYFLQYHIYTVALDKYLMSRLKNYDYRTHFGGVLYLFIRGMRPQFDSRQNPLPGPAVFFDYPDPDLIKELTMECF